jgi:hypothetical protein
VQYVFTFQFVVEVSDRDLSVLESYGIPATDFETAVITGDGSDLYIFNSSAGPEPEYTLGTEFIYSPDEGAYRMVYGPISYDVTMNRKHTPVR